MLVELKGVRQIAGEPERRIFLSDQFSLTVWLKNGAPCGFELAYDRLIRPHLVALRPGERATAHLRIDDGEGRAGRAKKTPIVVGNPDPIPPRLLENFVAESTGIEPSIASYAERYIRSL